MSFEQRALRKGRNSMLINSRLKAHRSLQYKGQSVATSTPGPAAPAPAAAKPRSLGDVLQEFSQHRKLMQEELQKVIVGQNDVIEQIFAAIFTRGHCLLVGVPGLAKTLMVSTLARILD